MGNDALEQKPHDLYSSGDIQQLSTQLAELGSRGWSRNGRNPASEFAAATTSSPSTSTTRERPGRRRVSPSADREAGRRLWIVEGTIDYGDGTPVSLVSILEADADGKISARPTTSRAHSRLPSGGASGWSRWNSARS